MYFIKSGSGRQPIVYLHGWGCDGNIFQPIAARLSDFSNYLVDMPGFGKGQSLPESGWCVADYVEDVYKFLEEQRLESVTIVAHSFGCRVATVLAAKHPEAISRMLFVAPAGLRRFSVKRWWRVRVYKLKKRFGRVDLTHATADYLACDGALRATFNKVINQNLASYARRIRCPVLIVNGYEDTATPLRQAQIFNKLIKNSSLAVINGDHFAFFRTPEAFAETLRNFVE